MIIKYFARSARVSLKDDGPTGQTTGQCSPRLQPTAACPAVNVSARKFISANLPGPSSDPSARHVLVRPLCSCLQRCLHTPLFTFCVCSPNHYICQTKYLLCMLIMWVGWIRWTELICYIYIYKRISSKFVSQKLKNGFAAGAARWRVHSVTPPDEHRLCPMSIRALC